MMAGSSSNIFPNCLDCAKKKEKLERTAVPSFCTPIYIGYLFIIIIFLRIEFFIEKNGKYKGIPTEAHLIKESSIQKNNSYLYR